MQNILNEINPINIILFFSFLFVPFCG